jgi:hypothetical protein
MKFVYFVAYQTPDSFGSVEISTPAALTTLDQIRAIESDLNETHGGSVSVRNWQLLREI